MTHARYYNPAIGQFISQDPMRGSLSDPASMNGFNYAGANPINFADPIGNRVEPLSFERGIPILGGISLAWRGGLVH